MGFALRCRASQHPLALDDVREGELISWVAPGAIVMVHAVPTGVDLRWSTPAGSFSSRWNSPPIRPDGLVKLLAVGDHGVLFSASSDRRFDIHTMYWAEAGGSVHSLGARSSAEPALAAVDEGPVTLSLAGDFTRYSRSGVVIEQRATERSVGLVRRSGRWELATQEGLVRLVRDPAPIPRMALCAHRVSHGSDRLLIRLSNPAIRVRPYAVVTDQAPSLAELVIANGTACVARVLVRGLLVESGSGSVTGREDWFDSEPGGVSIELESTGARTMRGRDLSTNAALVCSANAW
ncbi:MAG: hypothetical protein JNK05_25340 [Myxococcales bacterium]|nr:hypothetical protein [Myxococcales bacterium]